MTGKEFFHLCRHRFWSADTMLLLVRPAHKPMDETLRKPCPGEFRTVTEENIWDCSNFEEAEHYVPVYREMLKKGDY